MAAATCKEGSKCNLAPCLGGKGIWLVKMQVSEGTQGELLEKLNSPLLRVQEKARMPQTEAKRLSLWFPRRGQTRMVNCQVSGKCR